MSEHATQQTSAEFTPEVVEALHQEDIAAARNIVGLTLGIFLIGAVMYTIVAIICAG